MSDAKRLWSLERENRKLKKLLAELIGPGGVERASGQKPRRQAPVAQSPGRSRVADGLVREAVAHLHNVVQMSERRACIIVSADRQMIRYRSPAARCQAAHPFAGSPDQRRRFGYRRLFILLREHGEPSGINRIYRLYRQEGLTFRRRKARRKAIGTRTPILVEAKVNVPAPSIEKK